MSTPDPTQNGQQLPPDAQQIVQAVQALSDQVTQTGPPVVEEDLNEVLNALLHAVRQGASDASSANDTREYREHGQGALAFAQAWVIMHPSVVSPSGLPAVTQMQLDAARHPPPGPPPAPKEPGTTGRPPQPTARPDGSGVRG